LLRWTGSFVSPWGIKGNVKLVSGYQQAMCTLSNRNKVTLVCVPGHTGILGNEDADALARKGYGRPVLDPKPVTQFSPCAGRIKIKEWPTKKYLEYWAATPGTRESKLFIERPSERLSRATLALNREQCTLVKGLVTGHYTLRWHLHFISLSDNTICRKCVNRRRNAPITYFANTQLWQDTKWRSSVLHGWRWWILIGPQSNRFWLLALRIEGS
jgi:hypothetical protein